MIIIGFALGLSQRPVVAQAVFHRIGTGGIGSVIVTDAFARLDLCLLLLFFCGIAQHLRFLRIRKRCERRFFRIGKGKVFFIGGQRHGVGAGTGIFRPGILCQVGNGNPAFNIVVDDLAGSKVRAGVVGNGNLRAPVHGQDPAIACTGDLAGQVNLAAFGIDILNNQTVCLRIIVHLHYEFVCTACRVIYGLVAVVDLVHGTALYRRLAAIV